MKNCWKVFCEESEFPGLWPRWYKNQCVAVGWRPKQGQTLEGETDDRGWAAARKAIKCIKPGDMILVQLRNHRVGRVGEVVRKAIGDNEWNPTVPPSKENPSGGIGRRIQVRWDLSIGPSDPETVVLLPLTSRLAVVRPTICQIDSRTFDCVVKAMKDDANWVGLHGRFDRERSLSDYIATYPFRLEDSLMPYPDKKVRENAFDDSTRSDVLLIDKSGTPVVVECKQGAPTLENIQQLRGYMKHIHKITRKRPRGILVHGGAASLRDEVRKAVALNHSLRVIRYSLLVDFVPCT